MYRKKLSENQEGLLALVEVSKVDVKLSLNAKLVLGNIIMWYGTEYAKENGSFYRSTSGMMEDCEIGSKTTLVKAVRELELAELITVNRGKFGERGTASEYVLCGTLCEICGTPSGTPCGTPSKNEINELVEKIEDITLKYNELLEENARLRERLETLEKNSRCTTESDIEKEKEKNINKTRNQKVPSTRGKVDDNVRTWFYQLGRMWGERGVTTEEFFVNFNNEIESHPDFNFEERNELSSITISAYQEFRCPQRRPYTIEDNTSVVREAC